MDIIWISAAFIMGFGARLVGLPPLVGYLATGFILFAIGEQEGYDSFTALRESQTLMEFAEMGVTLLLFSLGLKLRLRSLLMPQIWGVALLHMSVVVVALTGLFFALAIMGLSIFSQLDLKLAALVAFALSFSSTVFAVKVLEDNGEMNALYGRIAIGILIMQDIVAVVFLAASTGKVPSLWALLLLLLIPFKPVLYKMMEKAGHGELLILFGLTLALGGAYIFELVGVKGDLGALLLGILMAQHKNASDLSRQLLGFKDLFLVGFFLVIGLAGLPTLEILIIAMLLLLLVPFKSIFFFWLLTKFKLRTRTGFLSALSLSNYSEFGLIVCSIGVTAGWINPEWLTLIAVSLALSFLLAAPFNTYSHNLYTRFREPLRRFQSDQRIEDEQPIDIGNASILVFGMGRVGAGAYDVMRDKFGDTVVGLDIDGDSVLQHTEEGRNVLRASASDPDFWDRFLIGQGKIRLAMLALPNHQENLFAAHQFKSRNFDGRLAAIVKYADEVDSLKAAGVDAVYYLYAEAGIGFANDVCSQLVSVSDEPAISG